VFCWAWNQTYYLMYYLGYPYVDFTSDFYNFTVIMVFLNCCVNPVIYSIRYDQVRTTAGSILATDSGDFGRIKGHAPPTQKTLLPLLPNFVKDYEYNGLTLAFTQKRFPGNFLSKYPHEPMGPAEAQRVQRSGLFLNIMFCKNVFNLFHTVHFDATGRLQIPISVQQVGCGSRSSATAAIARVGGQGHSGSLILVPMETRMRLFVSG